MEMQLFSSADFVFIHGACSPRDTSHFAYCTVYVTYIITLSTYYYGVHSHSVTFYSERLPNCSVPQFSLLKFDASKRKNKQPSGIVVLLVLPLLCTVFFDAVPGTVPEDRLYGLRYGISIQVFMILSTEIRL